MPAEFYSGTDWEQSSGPLIIRTAHEQECWPVADNSGSGTKDALEDGLHPVIAIGERTGAARGMCLTGVVTTVTENALSAALHQVHVNIASGMIVRQYVANVLTYAAGAAATFETTPAVGQPVYVDDSDDLGEGVTLSMSELNDADADNPLAGYLWYCQDEMADSFAGGARSSPTFDTALADELVEQTFCVLLISGARDV